MTRRLRDMDLRLLGVLQARLGLVPLEELLVEVWGLRPGTRTRTLDTHLHHLRRAGYRIHRVRGVGVELLRSREST